MCTTQEWHVECVQALQSSAFVCRGVHGSFALCRVLSSGFRDSASAQCETLRSASANEHSFWLVHHSRKGGQRSELPQELARFIAPGGVRGNALPAVVRSSSKHATARREDK